MGEWRFSRRCVDGLPTLGAEHRPASAESTGDPQDRGRTEVSVEWRLTYWGQFSVEAVQMTLRALREHRHRVPGCAFDTVVSAGSDGHQRIYFRESEVQREIGRARRLIADRSGIRRFCGASARTEERLRRFWTDVTWTQRTPNRELGEIYLEGNRHIQRLIAFYQLSSNHLSPDSVVAIPPALLTDAYNARDVLQCLVAPNMRGLDVKSEEVAWLRLCERWQAGAQRADVMDAIESHVERFAHLAPGGPDDAFSVASLVVRLSETTADDIGLLRLRVERSRWLSATCEEVAEVCARRLNLETPLLEQCRSVAALSVARLSQRESLQFAFERRSHLGQLILTRLRLCAGHDFDERVMRYMTVEEISGALMRGTPPDVSEVERRRSGFMMELDELRIRSWTGVQAWEREANLALPRAAPTAAQRTPRAGGGLGEASAPDVRLVGTVVSGSRAGVGRALILLKDRSWKREDLRMNDLSGRVLVTEMLRPFMIPYCRGAAGIVTEEGGLASHAAVIARELRIPCVVGVADATSVLRADEPIFVSVRTGRVWRLSEHRLRRLTRGSHRIDDEAEPPVLPEDEPGDDAGEVPAIVRLGSAHGLGSADVGGKAIGIERLGPLAPRGVVLTTSGVRSLRRGAEAGTWLEEVLKGPVRDIGAETLAFRSSHPLEDGAGRSYAGLFASVLDVPASDPERWLRAIDRVLESTDPRRLRVYEDREDFPPPAVIIQAMVEPVLSGVALTSLSSRGREWTILEYVPGRLEALVGGQVAPLRSSAMRADHASTAADLVPPVPPGIVGTELIDQLLSTLHDLEDRCGRPQEVEWAVDDLGTLWLLQTRPFASAR